MRRVTAWASFLTVFIKLSEGTLYIYENRISTPLESHYLILNIFLLSSMVTQGFAIGGIMYLARYDYFIKFASFFYILWVSALNFYSFTLIVLDGFSGNSYLVLFSAIVGGIQIPLGIALFVHKKLLGSNTPIIGGLLALSGLLMATVRFSFYGEILLTINYILLGRALLNSSYISIEAAA